RPIPHVIRFFHSFDPRFYKRPFRSADDINAHALAWIDSGDAKRPYFLFLNYLEAHHWMMPEAPYDGQIAVMDAALGRFIDTLKARGRYENALIVVTADHGELLGEHEQMGHGGRMMYEGLLHVPFVVKFPGATPPAARCASRCSW